MIAVFFPGFDRFIPGFDRFIPVSTDSSLLAFLLLEPSPLQSKCTLVNKMCFVLYFEHTLFHFIWNEYFLLKKHLSILRTTICAEK